MPFTISHAGFMLPLKGFLSAHVLCGLIIGSMAPDFGYFIREFGMASFAHSVAGAFCVSLPVGLAVYLLLRLFFRRIADTVPNPHSDYLISWGIDRPVAKRNLLGIMIAILLGALSHNFVDSFTHQSGTAVARFPGLSKEVFYVGAEPLHVFRILQYAGSTLGMLMIFVAYWFGLGKYCRERGCRVWQASPKWVVLIGLTSLTMLFAAGLNAESIPRELKFFAFRVFAFKFLITWLPIIGVAFLCYAMLRPQRPTPGCEPVDGEQTANLRESK